MPDISMLFEAAMMEVLAQEVSSRMRFQALLFIWFHIQHVIKMRWSGHICCVWKWGISRNWLVSRETCDKPEDLGDPVFRQTHLNYIQVHASSEMNQDTSVLYMNGHKFTTPALLAELYPG